MNTKNYKDCVDEEEVEVEVCDLVDEKEKRVSSLGDVKKGKPRIVSIEKVEVAPRGSKPGPKSSKKKIKDWNRPGLDQMDLTGTEGEESDGTEDEGRQLTRSSSRVSVQTCNSEVSEAPSTSSKGKGRPETTGAYRVKKAKREEKMALDRKRKLEEEIDEIMNPNFAMPPNKVTKIRDEVAERVEQYRVAPTVDLLSRMTEAADFVMRAAMKSSNLQGLIRGELIKAHYVLAAGTAVMASRADKETEGEQGEEVALLRIELEMAREDVKRMKEKAASDRKKLEDCFRRMEKMEEVAFTNKGKKRHRSAPQEDERDEEGRMQDVTMGEAGEEELPEPPVSIAEVIVPVTRPRVVLPPLEEWPAMRPPIKGVSKRMEDQASLPPPKGGNSLEDQILERLDRLLPRWLESRGIELPRKKEAKFAGQKDARKEAEARSEKQESRPSPPLKKRESKTTSRAGPLKKGPPLDNKNRSESSPTQGVRDKEEEQWTKVLGRKAKRENQTGGNKKKRAPVGTGDGKRILPTKGDTAGSLGKGKSRRKPPRTAAVVITCPEGRYGDVMRMARERVDLASLNIEGVRPRRAQTGALILEIPGKEGGSKADSLAGKLKEVFEQEEGVTIARPTKSAELRIRDLDESVSKDDIVMAVAEIGKCDIMEVKVGVPQSTQDGLRAVWVRCPVSAANKLAAAGRVRLGWVLARADLLRTRPLQCYKCLQPGHVRQKCPNSVDNGDRCYRCGVSGHKAQGCSAPPKCIVCEEAGKPAGHRMGGAACPLPKKRRGLENREGGAAKASPSKSAGEQRGSNEVAMEVEEMVAPPLSPPKEKRLPRKLEGGTAKDARNAS